MFEGLRVKFLCAELVLGSVRVSIGGGAKFLMWLLILRFKVLWWCNGAY